MTRHVPVLAGQPLRAPSLLARPAVLPLLIVAAGLLLRLLYLAHFGLYPFSLYEADRAAASVATSGVLGDAYQVGQGATAHLLPTTPLIAGLVYRLLGVHSPAAELLLALQSMLLVSAGFLLAYLAFARIGTPRGARLGALAFLCLLPTNFELETYWFKAWEGGLAVTLGALYLGLLLRLDRAAAPGARAIAGMAALAALAFFVSPQIGCGLYAATLLFMATRLPWRRWPLAIGAAVLALALLILPWTIRNERQFGAFIPLRSNFGLELAIAYHPLAVRPDQRDVFANRVNQIHPALPDNFRRMRAMGGEIPYNQALGDGAKAWIGAHPGAALRIAGRHLVEFLFPPLWYWQPIPPPPDWHPDSPAKLLLKRAEQSTSWLAYGLGFLGACWALALGDRRRRYAALMLVVTILPYAMVQPTLRYRYTALLLATFLAADLLAQATTAARAQWRPSRRPA
ncbi:hypothetical protein HMF7854_00340 [Sphingomonas ginkgonis]|uniref:Glycosyltransferase RgtA/B/C/D-like domain-containing protein n=1 Tax=Sphingomonas ginkgonis TaxID=2315330 RepID=A0A429V669_9SPHN|nr:hypothetical protein [Sphingomonas ginkgonis]RST29448.1 hypothetical protein HMF7854_00340 [Sphingomonas ginkgonis]